MRKWLGDLLRKAGGGKEEVPEVTVGRLLRAVEAGRLTEGAPVAVTGWITDSGWRHERGRYLVLSDRFLEKSVEVRYGPEAIDEAARPHRGGRARVVATVGREDSTLILTASSVSLAM